MTTETVKVWAVLSDGQLIDTVFAAGESEADAFAADNGYFSEYPSAEVHMLSEGENGYQAPRVRKVR